MPPPPHTCGFVKTSFMLHLIFYGQCSQGLAHRGVIPRPMTKNSLQVAIKNDWDFPI